MPTSSFSNPRISKSIRGAASLMDNTSIKFDPAIVGRTVVDGQEYLKSRLQWSGTKIANTLHLPPNTINAWLNTLHPELSIVPEKLMSESIDGLIFIRQYLDYIRGTGT